MRGGGTRVAGRRVATGGGRPVVLTALGSGEKIFALLPVAILSAASVAGLVVTGNGGSASSASPPDAGSAATAVDDPSTSGQHREDRARPSARPTISQSASPLSVATEAGSRTADDELGSADESPVAREESESTPSAAPTTDPSDPAVTDEPTPLRTDSPSPSPVTTPLLTRAEATAQCLASGISALDLVALTACVDSLLRG